MVKNRFVMDSLEGVKLIHPDGREEYVKDMKLSEEQEPETDTSPKRTQRRTKSATRRKSSPHRRKV